jgi:hypothetical protein
MLVKRTTPVDAFAAFWTPWTAFLNQILIDGNAITHHSPPMHLQRSVFLELFMVPGGQIARLSFRGLSLACPSLLFCYFLLLFLHDPLLLVLILCSLGHDFFLSFFA